MTATPGDPGFQNGQVSFWYRDLGVPTPRQALPGRLEVDVAIVGGGYTGLWTAYYLKKVAVFFWASTGLAVASKAHVEYNTQSPKVVLVVPAISPMFVEKLYPPHS